MALFGFMSPAICRDAARRNKRTKDEEMVMSFSSFCRCVSVLCLVLALTGYCFQARAAASGAPSAGPNASFDCSKAATADERIICSDPLLRQADLDLASAYRAARGASKDPAHRAMLKNDEHQWILRRNNECSITKYTVITDGNRPGFVDCLLDQYGERIADLQQMKLHPKVDPATISSPIRRSFSSAAKPAALPADISLSTFQIPGGGQAAALSWLPDGTLVILGAGTAGDGKIYTWRNGNLGSLAKLPDTAAGAGLCSAPGGTMALPGANSPQCAAAKDEIAVSGPDGATLNLGPARTGMTPAPRFVTLTNSAGVVQVTPPIRIDSRYHFTARYVPLQGVFVVSQVRDSGVLDYAAVRRWSKTDCLAYWTVSPNTAAATRNCIPFGPYEAAVPLPLLTKNAVYFAAAGYGLYRIAAAGVQPVLSGNFAQPVVSPDGCSIALEVQGGSGAAAQGAPVVQLGGSGIVTVLSVCGAAANAVAGNLPAAP